MKPILQSFACCMFTVQCSLKIETLANWSPFNFINMHECKQPPPPPSATFENAYFKSESFPISLSTFFFLFISTSSHRRPSNTCIFSVNFTSIEIMAVGCLVSCWCLCFCFLNVERLIHSTMENVLRFEQDSLSHALELVWMRTSIAPAWLPRKSCVGQWRFRKRKKKIEFPHSINFSKIKMIFYSIYLHSSNIKYLRM